MIHALDDAVVQFLTPRPVRESQRDQGLLERGTAIALDCGLAATIWGEGPTVLLAHGWESRRTHWGAFVEPLVSAGFRPLAVDAPAHGDSPGETTNVLDYAIKLTAIGRQIGPIAGAVGHSFGAGAVAIAIDRGLVAKRAVLISGPSSLTSVLERWARGFGIADDKIPGFIRGVEDQVGEPLATLDIARFAHRLKIPALIIHDRNDKEIPVSEALAVAAAWPGASTFITERYGHRRIMVATEIVEQVTHFLTTASAQLDDG